MATPCTHGISAVTHSYKIARKTGTPALARQDPAMQFDMEDAWTVKSITRDTAITVSRYKVYNSMYINIEL